MASFKHYLVGALRDIGIELGGIALGIVVAFFRKRGPKNLAMTSTMNKESKMEKELLEGSEHNVALKMEGGKIGLVGAYAGKGGGANVELSSTPTISLTS